MTFAQLFLKLTTALSSGLLNYDFEYISHNTSHFFSTGMKQQAYPDKAYS